MANQASLHAHFFHLVDSHLTRECTTTLEVAVLRADLGTIGDLVCAVVGVQRGWAEVDIALARVAIIDVLDETILGLL